MKEALGGFMTFIKEQNIIGAAVGIIMGLKAGEVVKSLVEDVIMPLVLKLIPGGSIETIADLTAYGVKYGKFISTFIDFLIVAAVVYFVINGFQKKFSKEAK